MRDAEGRAIGPCLFKVRRGAAPGLGIGIGAPASVSAPSSRILGSWFCLPEGGRLDGLPSGRLSVELLPGPVFDETGRLVDCPHPVLERDVVVRAGEVTPAVVSSEPGIPFELVVRPPLLAANEAVVLHYVVRLTSVQHPELSQQDVRLVEPDGEFPSFLLTDGSPHRFRSLASFAPGDYDVAVTVHETRLEQQLDPAKGRVEQKSRGTRDHGPFHCRVVLAPGAQPMAVDLR